MAMVNLESTLNTAGYRCRTSAYDARVLLFEDESIFGFVASFESAAELLESWRDKQSTFIQRTAGALRRSSMKSWNCYAIFICFEDADDSMRKGLSEIEEDLSLTRKLVADGVATQRDIQRALLPILPIQNHALPAAKVILDLAARLDTWPESALLALQGDASPRDLVEILLDAK
jgi:hypothetical protein